jgi:hypothetical protein
VSEWPGIAIPGWNQRPSGLWVRTDLQVAQPVQLPDELVTTARTAILVTGQPPGWRDQVGAYLTVEELGFPKPSEEQVIGAIARLPFAATILALAHLQYELWPHRADVEFQKDLLDRVIPVSDSEFRQSVHARLEGEEHLLIFSEQAMFAMQRLVMLFAPYDDRDATIEDDARFVGVLFSVPAAFLNPDQTLETEQALEPGEEERWIRYFIAHGGLFPTEWFGASVARAHRIYTILGCDEISEAHHQHCPMDEWMVEDFGLSILELQALGMGLSVGAGVFDETVTAPRPVLPTFFDSTALSDRPDAVLNTLGADRDWFQTELGRSQADPQHVARNFLPFFQRPAIRRDDGSQLLLSPRALQEAIGDHGLYFRLLDRAISRGQRQRFSNFNGWLYERYAVELAELALARPEHDVAVHARVIREQPYAADGQTLVTPDIAIDCGLDLVLIEVTSSHLTTRSLIDGDPEKVRDDLSKALVDKIVQLARRIVDLQAGAASLPGVDLEQVERIWPILVYADALFLSQLLWDYIAANGGAELDQRRVQPLTLLEMTEFERLMSFSSTGWLPDILERKTAPMWRQRDFASWVAGDPWAPDGDGLDLMRVRWNETFRAVAQALWPGHDPDAYIAPS